MSDGLLAEAACGRSRPIPAVRFGGIADAGRQSVAAPPRRPPLRQAIP
jgi:hypothetical protein